MNFKKHIDKRTFVCYNKRTTKTNTNSLINAFESEHTRTGARLKDVMETNESWKTEESAAVWEQLLRLAEGGDIRAIKLYYDMLEKKQHPAPKGTCPSDMEPMAAIRRAVFGDAAVDAAASAAAGKLAGGGGIPPMAMGDQTSPDAEGDDDW